eukprot:GHVP01009780.1.p1 GENE.GHVP01009780.1~~GHVP01009780.1.p1  ORF type:complete len:691 (-),score=120.64 GHVP01009780.1:116-2140(-)
MPEVCRLNKSPGFDFEFKSLWEDFHVHEVDVSGNIVKLEESLTKSQVRQVHSVDRIRETGEEFLDGDATVLPESLSELSDQGIAVPDFVNGGFQKFISKLSEFSQLSTEKKNSRKENASGKVNENTILDDTINLPTYGGDVAIFVGPAGDDKERRKSAHNWFRQNHSFLTTECIEFDDLKKAFPEASIIDDNSISIPLYRIGTFKLDAPQITVHRGKEKASLVFLAFTNDGAMTRIFNTAVRFKRKPSLPAAKKKAAKKPRNAKDRKALTTNEADNPLDIDFLEEKQFRLHSSKSESNRWPDRRPDYLHFIVCKKNRDTADVINMIANCTSTNSKNFTFAGTKDKRAVTTQLVSAYKVSDKTLLSAVLRPNWDRNVRIQVLGYFPNPIKLGYLTGNHFDVCLRNIALTDEKFIDESLNSLKKKGFVNYFGKQRFGNYQIPTWRIGAALYAREWKNAVDCILWRPDNNRKGRENVYGPERYVTDHLSDAPNDYQGALKKISNHTLMLYYHSAQSLIWNYLASAKIKSHEDSVLVGDYYLKEDGNVAQVLSEKQAKETNIEDIVLPILGEETAISKTHPLYRQSAVLCRCLFGFNVEVLQESSHLCELAGGWRTFISRPKNLKWEVVKMQPGPLKSMIKSDVDSIIEAEKNKNQKESSDIIEKGMQMNNLDSSFDA